MSDRIDYVAAEPMSDWLRCDRCGWAWDDLNLDHGVCACLDRHGYREATHISALRGRLTRFWKRLW